MRSASGNQRLDGAGVADCAERLSRGNARVVGLVLECFDQRRDGARVADPAERTRGRRAPVMALVAQRGDERLDGGRAQRGKGIADRIRRGALFPERGGERLDGARVADPAQRERRFEPHERCLVLEPAMSGSTARASPIRPE